MKRVVRCMLSIGVALLLTQMLLDYGRTGFEAVTGGFMLSYIFTTLVELAIED